jgi:hypothetical protein
MIAVSESSTGLDPVGLQQRRGLCEPRRLDDDVRPDNRLAPRLDHADALAERLLEPAPERLARLRPGARDADLV